MDINVLADDLSKVLQEVFPVRSNAPNLVLVGHSMVSGGGRLPYNDMASCSKGPSRGTSVTHTRTSSLACRPPRRHRTRYFFGSGREAASSSRPARRYKRRWHQCWAWSTWMSWKVSGLINGCCTYVSPSSDFMLTTCHLFAHHRMPGVFSYSFHTPRPLPLLPPGAQ